MVGSPPRHPFFLVTPFSLFPRKSTRVPHISGRFCPEMWETTDLPPHHPPSFSSRTPFSPANPRRVPPYLRALFARRCGRPPTSHPTTRHPFPREPPLPFFPANPPGCPISPGLFARRFGRPPAPPPTPRKSSPIPSQMGIELPCRKNAKRGRPLKPQLA